MATLTIKDIDDRLYQALRARAAVENRSIDQEVITIIQKFLTSPVDGPPANGRELLKLAGSWQDERSAEEISSDFRKSRLFGRQNEASFPIIPRTKDIRDDA
jgi:plasmid stability protein